MQFSSRTVEIDTDEHAMAHLPTTKRLLSAISVVVFLGCCFVAAVDAAPFGLTTQEPIGDEENYNSGVPFEFPDDYSISLEEAVVSWAVIIARRRVLS